MDASTYIDVDAVTAIPANIFYQTSNTPTARGRGRPRKSTAMHGASETKRKRVDDDGQKEIDKKRRVDDKKAATHLVGQRRESRDLAMKKWLKSKLDIFRVLLPARFPLLETLASSQLGPPLEFHQLLIQPALIQGGEMKEYQLHGLSFLAYMYRNGMNCILGDEMGLGKTLQTLSLFAYIQEYSPMAVDAPHLIICPLSVLSSWEAECARWIPSFRVVRFHGPAAQRALLKQSILTSEPNLVLTTYESFSAEDVWFKSHRWTYCVLDEGHKIKNSDTQIANRLRGLGSLHRLVLTGTPVQNDLTEVWGLLHWLYPTVFTVTTEANFKEAFDVGQGKYDLDFVEGVRKLLAVVMLRRTKATVEIDVPPKEETTLFLPMCDAQRFWTYRLLTEMDGIALDSVFGSGVDDERREALKHLQTEVGSRGITGETKLWQKLNFMLLQLMRLCDHPYLLPGAEPEPYIPNEDLINSSSKIIAIDKILADVLPKGEQVLIFSQWTGMLDILSDFLRLRKITFARLDGSTLRPRRSLDIKMFQKDNSPFKVFLISTQAGGLGINLTKASTVIMADSSWNPQNDLQAIARAHRIGQKKVVQVYRLICRASVEDQMLDRLRRKLFLSLKVMSDSGSISSGGGDAQLGLSEIRDILRRGSSALSTSEPGMDIDFEAFMKAPINHTIELSKERERARVAKIEKEEGVETDGILAQELIVSAEEEERQLLSGVAQVKCRLFEGKMHEKSKKNKDNGMLLKIDEDEDGADVKVKRVRKMSTKGLTPDQVQKRAEARDKLAREEKQKRKKSRKWENEDYCIYVCDDERDVIMCDACPRVFHARCAGMSAADMKKPLIYCPQHRCFGCGKNAVEGGGMLFRCRTCPHAYCEECLPASDDDWKIVGESLPEFESLNYRASTAAFFIHCENCVTTERTEPLWWEQTWGKALRKGAVQ